MSRLHSAVAGLSLILAGLTSGSWESPAHARATPPPGSALHSQRRPASEKIPPQKILYFEGAPRPEMKFITRAMGDVSAIRLVVLQRTTDGKYMRIGVDNADELRDGFPSTRDELFKYRGLILGSVDAGLFTAEQHRMIADFVTARGGGLLALGGDQSFGEGGWLETPLAYLLPIAFDPNRNRQSPRLLLKVRARPTDLGRDHPALQIADDRTTAERLWHQLPVVTIVNAVYPRPASDILMTGNDPEGREQVILVTQTYSSGRVAAFTPQDSWVWQMNAKVDSPAHERFWRGLLAWLVENVPH